MKMSNVATDGDESSERNSRFVSSAQQRNIFVWRLGVQQQATQRLAQSHGVCCALTCGIVRHSSVFFRATKCPGAKSGGHVLRGRPGHCNLGIVDKYRAVGRECGDETS